MFFFTPDPLSSTVSTIATDASEDGGGDATVTYPDPVDYSAAIRASLDNSKTTALGQIMTQRFALQQAAMDRDLQRAANLELSLEKFDTKLQVGALQYRQMMTAEENQHVEKVAKIEADAGRFNRLAASASESTPDLPAPASFHSDFEKENKIYADVGHLPSSA